MIDYVIYVFAVIGFIVVMLFVVRNIGYVVGLKSYYEKSFLPDGRRRGYENTYFKKKDKLYYKSDGKKVDSLPKTIFGYLF